MIPSSFVHFSFFRVDSCSIFGQHRGRTAEEATENVLNEQLPELQRLQAAGELNVDSIDVFCEKGVFDVDQSHRILEAGRRAGLRLNFHADELTPLGGAEVHPASKSPRAEAIVLSPQ